VRSSVCQPCRCPCCRCNEWLGKNRGSAYQHKQEAPSSATDAIATSAQPTANEAANADNSLDAILEQIRRLGENQRESLWDALAGQWPEEISRAFACRLIKTDELRREALSACATPSHPDVGGGPFCERVYAIGSREWAEQQRRRENGD
jgi:hypothetical protein